MEELKEMCKEKKIKIVPYNEKHYDELKIKRRREEDVLNDSNEQNIKRLKTDFNGQLKNDCNSVEIHSSSYKNGEHDNNGLKDKLKSSIVLTSKSNSNGKLIVDLKFMDCVIKLKNEKPPNGLNGYALKQHLDDNPENIRTVLRGLENFRNLEKRMEFYNKMKEYEIELNEKLVKYGHKPIIVRNNVDLQLPPKFEYVNEYKLDQLSEETLKKIEANVQRCECKNQCVSVSRNISECCFSAYGDNCFYGSLGTIKHTCLKRGPIIECTNKCSCSEKCPNRVIQNGTQVRLEIFKTTNGRGWGLKSLDKLLKGTFITAYRGEVITSEEALKRQANSQFKDKYFFNLDYNEELEFEYVVDATHTANLGRFLNHSCLPNCETFIAYVENNYMPMPVIAFFTNRLIKENEELSIDYYMGAEKNPISNPEEDDVKITCLCRSDYCRKYIF